MMAKLQPWYSDGGKLLLCYNDGEILAKGLFQDGSTVASPLSKRVVAPRKASVMTWLNSNDKSVRCFIAVFHGETELLNPKSRA